MIRILFTIPNFDTAGSGKALFNIAKGLDKNKFEVHIMCKHRRGAFFETIENSGIPVHICNYETPMIPRLKGILGCWKVSRILKKIKPDIIHSFNYSADYSEGLATRLAGSKWVFTKKNMNWGGGSKNAWLMRSALADKIAVQNTDMIEQFYKKNKKIVLIPRGVDTEFYKPEKNKNGNSNGQKKTIVCVANLVPVKGVEILIEAFNKICKQSSNNSWNLKIVGDDKNLYGMKLKSQYHHLVNDGRLSFTGKVQNVKEELEHSAIFALPTLNQGRMEGSPVSILEAMSMGLIVLGSRIPGIKDQLEPLGDDHLFKAGDVVDLSQKLKKFMEMTGEESSLLRKNIRDYCRDNWDIEIEIRKHEQFYCKVIGIPEDN